MVQPKPPHQPLTPADFERLTRLDTPTAANAIERFDVRPRNEGFAYGAARCMFPDRPPMLGYAVTAQIRTSTQPITGAEFHDRAEFWARVDASPSPCVIVLQDVDSAAGFGAFFGELHAAVAGRLGAVGCITDGAVRDLPAVDALGFRLFAGGVSPSHAYAHVVALGGPVEIGGLKIQPGDLIHGDRHGLLMIPMSIAADLPAAADRIQEEERELLELCRSPKFSLAALQALLPKIRPKKPAWYPTTPTKERSL